MKKTVLGYLLSVFVYLGMFGGVVVGAAVSTASLANADALQLKNGHPQTYVVKKGDTLWDISQMFLNNPWQWPEIWHVNPQVDNPHLIYPGDVLNLVYIDGRPQLVVKRGRDIKLSPQVRISELDLAIPAIPLDAISPFLSESRVVSRDALRNAPYVLAGTGGRIVSGAGDELFSRGPVPEDQLNYGIFRPGDAYTDPDTRELLGYQAFFIAGAKVLDVQRDAKGKEPDIATLALNKSTEEVRRGDRLLPDEERQISANFYPDAPDNDITGYIIAVEGGVSQIGSMDVVVLNKGARDGLEVGHVMAIYRVGERVRDVVTGDIVKVPDARAGLLMVFRTFDKVSYGLVLKATKPLAVMDRVTNP